MRNDLVLTTIVLTAWLLPTSFAFSQNALNLSQISNIIESSKRLEPADDLKQSVDQTLAIEDYKAYDYKSFEDFYIYIYGDLKSLNKLIVIKGSESTDNKIFKALHAVKGCASSSVWQSGLSLTLTLLAAPIFGITTITGFIAEAIGDFFQEPTFTDNLGDMYKYLHTHITMTRKLDLKKDEQESSDFFITGHSMGGLLAQYFALKLQIDGCSFNAPGLGAYDDLTQIDNYLAREQMYLSRHQFYNHRLEGDWVSKTNRAKGHLGSLVTHKHNLWGSFWQQFDVASLHSLEPFREHLNKWNCGTVNCCGKDGKTGMVYYLSYLISL